MNKVISSPIPLPDISALQKHCQGLAMLNAILSPEFVYRYHRFDAHWGEGEQMASLDNGAGDHVFIWFAPAGCFIKGFDHESEMSPYANDPSQIAPGILEAVPEEFTPALQEPAFCMEDITFCIWNSHHQSGWYQGVVEGGDGASWLLWSFTCGTEEILHWIEDYFEVSVPLWAVEHVLALKPLTAEVVQVLNPELGLSDLSDDIIEIGYPA